MSGSMSTNDHSAGFHNLPTDDDGFNWHSDDSFLADVTIDSTQPTSFSTEPVMSRQHQDDILMDFFKKNQHPDGSQTLELALQTLLSTNDVEDWFRSHRDLAACLFSGHSQQTPFQPSGTVENKQGPSPTLRSSELLEEFTFPVTVTNNKVDVPIDGVTSESSSRSSKNQEALGDAQLCSMSAIPVREEPKPVLQCVGDDHPCRNRFQTSDRISLCNHENGCHFPKKAFRCDECSPPKWFPKTGNGKNHLVNAHTFVEGPHLDQYFKRQCHSIDHMFHDTCGFEGCNKTFNDRGDSVKHIRDHLEVPGIGRLQWSHRCRRSHKLEDHPYGCYCASDDDGGGDDDGKGGDDGNDHADQDHDGPYETHDEPDEGSQGQGRSGHGRKDGSSHPDAASGSGNGGQIAYKSASAWPTRPKLSVTEDGPDHQQPLPILGEAFGKSDSPSSSPNHLPMMYSGRLLGAGAFGAVYEVKIWPAHRYDRMSIPSVFAVKRFSAAPAKAGVLDAFERERAVLSSLKNQHRHILQYFGSFRYEDKFHIILGPVADMNLAQYLQTCRGHVSTPSLKAARCGHTSSAGKLLNAGANINTRRKCNECALGNTGNMPTSTCGESPSPTIGPSSAIESPPGKTRGIWNVTDLHGEGEENVLIQSMGCLASALEYLHATTPKHGPIVHGDIKPSNILVFLGDNTCNMRIADFGSSSMVAPAERTTEARTRAFTRTYQPPECKEKRLPPNRSADIWSMGCVFLEMVAFMLYEHHYTRGVNSSESWHMRAKEWLLTLSGQEKEHSRTKAEKHLPYDIVLKMLSMNPSERPTARAVVHSLPHKCHCAGKSVNSCVSQSQLLEAVASLPTPKADVEQRMATTGSGKDFRMPIQRLCDGILEIRSDTTLIAQPEHGRITSQEMISDNSILFVGSQFPSGDLGQSQHFAWVLETKI